ncbi:hypothetical protein RIR_jg22141.t1 [Rhizophagus irregularis DAOM 181602=DAOM 197198]|nr:hypothetical protein RIR_jg22141.t1 [Rhizophagus irregularis DAOM 181602=DAOM 197198]
MLWRWRIPEEGNEYDGDTKDHHRRSSFTDSNQRIFPNSAYRIHYSEEELYFLITSVDERKNLRITIESNQVTRTSELFLHDLQLILLRFYMLMTQLLFLELE